MSISKPDVSELRRWLENYSRRVRGQESFEHLSLGSRRVMYALRELVDACDLAMKAERQVTKKQNAALRLLKRLRPAPEHTK